MKLALAAIFLIAGFSLAEDRTPSPFEAGNKAFEQGAYGEAIHHYTQQLESGLVSPDLHYNLANAAFHDSQIGLSIYHYRTAQELAPRYRDVRHNLKIARDEVHNGTPPKPSTFSRLTGFLTLNEWTLAGMLLLSTWLGWLTAVNLKPAWAGHARTFRPVLGFLAIALTIITLLTWREHSEKQWAVIHGEATVRFGPVSASPDQFKWFDGAEVAVVRTHRDWFLAQDATGRQGWVHSDSILTHAN